MFKGERGPSQESHLWSKAKKYMLRVKAGHLQERQAGPNRDRERLPEMMLLPSLMKSRPWQVMLGTVIRSSSLLDIVCHTLMSFLAQVANNSAVPLQRSHQEKREAVEKDSVSQRCI